VKFPISLNAQCESLEDKFVDDTVHKWINASSKTRWHLMPTRGLSQVPTPLNNYITSTLIQFETFSTQWSTQKHSEKFMVSLEGTVHELIMTPDKPLASVVAGCHKNPLVVDFSNLQVHLPLTHTEDIYFH
jgi:hypothetical protein